MSDDAIDLVSNSIHLVNNPGGVPGGGTVTQVNTVSPLSGGPITTSGSISIANYTNITKGTVPASGTNDHSQVLWDDGWALPSGGGLTFPIIVDNADPFAIENSTHADDSTALFTATVTNAADTAGTWSYGAYAANGADPDFIFKLGTTEKLRIGQDGTLTAQSIDCRGRLGAVDAFSVSNAGGEGDPTILTISGLSTIGTTNYALYDDASGDSWQLIDPNRSNFLMMEFANFVDANVDHIRIGINPPAPGAALFPLHVFADTDSDTRIAAMFEWPVHQADKDVTVGIRAFNGADAETRLSLTVLSNGGGTMTLGSFSLAMAASGLGTFAGAVEAASYALPDLNTAPASAGATGVKGEIRWAADFVYLCTATNTWVRAALTTWI